MKGEENAIGVYFSSFLKHDGILEGRVYLKNSIYMWMDDINFQICIICTDVDYVQVRVISWATPSPFSGDDGINHKN